jgi:hypothetical protein
MMAQLPGSMASMMVRATVLLPLPLPPATPMM